MTLPRIFRTLFIALVLTGAFVTTVSASYTSGSKTTVLHGASSDYILNTSIGKINCRKTTLKAHTESLSSLPPYTVKELTVSPTHNECIFFGFPGYFKTNGCDYRFLEAKEMKASVEIVCPVGKSMELELGTCTMLFGPQLLAGYVFFGNEGAGKTADVKTSASLSGISYSGSCGSGTTGTLTGTLTMKGYTSEAMTTQVGISVM